MNLLGKRHSTPNTKSTAQEHAQITSALLAENLGSPNAVPPRTSSAGVVTNGTPEARPKGKKSSTVLRPINEIDWLSQGKRVSQEALSSFVKSHRRMTSPPHNGAIFNPVDTVPGASRDRDLSEQLFNESSPPRKVHRRFEMAEPLPDRKSSRHRLSSSVESRTSSKAAAPHSHHTSTMSSPPPDPTKNVTDDLIHQRQRPWPADKERILLAPYTYLLEHPGKDIRKQLIAAFNEWLNVPEDSLKIITRVVGMLHTASLLYVYSPIFHSNAHPSNPSGKWLTMDTTALTT